MAIKAEDGGIERVDSGVVCIGLGDFPVELPRKAELRVVGISGANTQPVQISLALEIVAGSSVPRNEMTFLPGQSLGPAGVYIVGYCVKA